MQVVLDFKPGRLPIPAPPELERLERSTIMADAEAAGLELISAPAILDCFNILGEWVELISAQRKSLVLTVRPPFQR